MKKFLAALFIGIAVFLSPTQAAAAGCTDTVLAIPAWYKGMQDGSCRFDPVKNGAQVDVVKTSVRIGMNVLQAALVIAGYVAVIMLIRGGFMYMLAAGDVGGMTNAKKTITNAVVGLIIAVLAASIVNAIASLVR